LTQPTDPVTLLALAVYQLGGSLEISKELLDSMGSVRLVLDQETNPDYIRLAVLSNEVLVGQLEDDVVNVINHVWYRPEDYYAVNISGEDEVLV